MKTKLQTEKPISPEELKRLGFTNAGNKIKTVLDFNKKVAIAYEHFRYVKPEQFKRFNDRLKQETLKIVKSCPRCHNLALVKKKCWYCQGTGAQKQTYDKLVFTPIEKYPEVPPKPTLKRLKEVQEMKCFDRFEIAKIESVQELPDPILFGCIDKCPDKFFISQWDDDVKIEDILEEHEG